MKTAARENPGSPFLYRGPMACFRTKVRQQTCPLWAYILFQDKSPPTNLPAVGLWLVSEQMPANKPARPWAYILFQDKSPPTNLPAVGLWLDLKQKSANQPARRGPMACFKTKVRQRTRQPWAYGLFQDKSPPTNPPAVGLWLVSGQMSANEPVRCGPIACFRAKVRQQTCPSWAYGSFQDKSPPIR